MAAPPPSALRLRQRKSKPICAPISGGIALRAKRSHGSGAFAQTRAQLPSSSLAAPDDSCCETKCLKGALAKHRRSSAAETDNKPSTRLSIVRPFPLLPRRLRVRRLPWKYLTPNANTQDLCGRKIYTYIINEILGQSGRGKTSVETARFCSPPISGRLTT